VLKKREAVKVLLGKTAAGRAKEADAMRGATEAAIRRAANIFFIYLIF
jgi:hypothetical protein